MQDVRDHLVAMMERLGDQDADERDINRAKALSELAATYTRTVSVEIEARRAAGIEATLPYSLTIGHDPIR